MNNLTIIQVNSMLSGGGTDDQCLKLSVGLRKKGCDVILAGPSRAELVAQVQQLEIPLHGLSRSKACFIWGLSRLIRKTSPQIVQAHHGRDYWPTVIARWLSGRSPRLILTRHLAKSPSSFLSKRFLLNRCDTMVAVSQFVAKVLKEGVDEPDSPVKERHSRPPLRGDQRRIRVIYGGIDTNRFRPLPAEDQRAEWGLKPEHVAFAVAGAYDFPVGKGQREFLEAAALIHEQIAEARFLIIGRGTMRDFLNEEIKRLGLEGKAWLTPYAQDMPTAMNAIDCLVHPAQGTEAFGLVLVEAFACGKPVIATKLDGVPEAYAFGQQGQLIENLSPSSIAQAMLAVGSRGRSKISTETIEHIRKSFSLERMTDHYLQLYRSKNAEQER